MSKLSIFVAVVAVLNAVCAAPLLYSDPNHNHHHHHHHHCEYRDHPPPPPPPGSFGPFPPPPPPPGSFDRFPPPSPPPGPFGPSSSGPHVIVNHSTLPPAPPRVPHHNGEKHDKKHEEEDEEKHEQPIGGDGSMHPTEHHEPQSGTEREHSGEWHFDIDIRSDRTKNVSVMQVEI